MESQWGPAAIRCFAARPALIVLAAAAICACGGGGGGYGSSAPPNPPPAVNEPVALTLSGDIADVHDPALIRQGSTWVLFSTGDGILERRSTDLRAWQFNGDVLGGVPAWAQQAIPGVQDLWAPDISFFNGRYHLYYSASTFGSGRSAVGLATNPSLDPGSPDYDWTDQGLVIESQEADDFNAIDPNIILDQSSAPWLVLGSWNDTGIRLRRIDPDTGMPSSLDPTLYSLADRPAASHAIEAPYIIFRNGFYYLFVSFDRCCQGLASTYNVRVGRSLAITGPYADRAGNSMLTGGGTLLLSGTTNWRGPGHNAIVEDGGQTYIVYHSYSGADNGRPYLRISPLDWDASGWPSVPTS